MATNGTGGGIADSIYARLRVVGELATTRSRVGALRRRAAADGLAIVATSQRDWKGAATVLVALVRPADRTTIYRPDGDT